MAKAVRREGARQGKSWLGMAGLAVVAAAAVLAGLVWFSQQSPAPAPAQQPSPAVFGPSFAPPAPSAPGKARLVEISLLNADVQDYVQRNSAYFVDDSAPSEAELAEDARAYPVIYGNLSWPVYQLRFSSPSGEELLVLLNSSEVLRVFAVQSIKA